MTNAIIRLPAVQARTGLSRSGVYARMAAGAFPKQIHLGPRAVGWLESEIDSFLEQCVAASRQQNGGL
jgi:prophage regulatory protein